MDMSTILQAGISAIQGNSDDTTSDLDGGLLSGALEKLVGEGEGLDLSSMVDNLQEGGLGELASSWLGDGENAAIDPEEVTSLFGEEKVAEFASELGLDMESAKGAIADALPQMVDNASDGGSLVSSLLDHVGGVEGVIDLAKKFFGR
jgi:uncharacterized protein YidB (DUF937 family)